MHPPNARLFQRPAGRAAQGVLLAVLFAPMPAEATGSFSCAIADKSVAFEAEAVFSHGLGGVFSNFSAHLALKGEGVPQDLAGLELDNSALVHHWFHGDALKLQLYHERAHGAVELVLETRRSPKDEILYEGRYVLEVSELPDGASEPRMRRFKGIARCEVG